MRFPFSRRPAAVDCYLRAPEVSAVRHGDRVVVLDPRREAFYSLDGVAGRVWELLDRPATAAGLSERIAGEYEVPIEVVARDLTELLADLERNGLVVEGRA